MLFDAAVCGLLAGILAGGSLRRLLDMPLRRLWLLAGAVLASLLPHVPLAAAPLTRLGTAGAVCFALVRYGLLLAFVAFNRRCVPVDLIGAGGALNMLVTLANSGRMPVAASALAGSAAQNAPNELLQNGRLLIYTLANAHTRLAFLCDQISIPAYDWLFRRVRYELSIGDLLIAAGVFALIVTLMKPTRFRKLRLQKGKTGG